MTATFGVREDILKDLFLQETWTVPTLYLSLYGDYSGDEAAATRQIADATMWTFNSLVVGDTTNAWVENTGDITFTGVTASTIGGIDLWDAETSGNVILSQAFDGGDIVVPVFSTVVLEAADINISLNHA